MTYGEICKVIKEHRGRVYACVNLAGCQLHVEAKKGAAYDLFFNYGLDYGMDNDSGATVEVRSGDLFVDAASEN
jgi:hypothetical protein